MSYEALLAKLTEGAQDYKPRGDPSWNPNQVTWEDIAFCLHGVTGGAYYIIRAKWLLDESAKSGIYVSLREKILDNNWLNDKKLRRGVWERISQVLVWDYLDERHCPKCGGTGLRIDQRPCPSCEDGRIKRNQQTIIDMAEITQLEWKRIAKRYEYLYRVMSGWETQGLAKAKENFYGD